jgi:hypothetical protein
VERAGLGDSYRWEVTTVPGSHTTFNGCRGPGHRVSIEQASGNGWYRALMADAYLPAGWPEAVAPPGAADWEHSAVNWLVDLAPDLRGHTAIRRFMRTRRG